MVKVSPGNWVKHKLSNKVLAFTLAELLNFYLPKLFLIPWFRSRF